MNVKQVVEVSKNYIVELFGNEDISEIGLEEVELDEQGLWHITIGFARPWERNMDRVLVGMRPRTYKVLIVHDKDGSVLSAKNRISSEQ